MLQRHSKHAARAYIYIGSIIPEVLGESDTRVDGSLTGGHGHVGRVGDEGGALHDAHLLASDVDRQLGELVQHLPVTVVWVHRFKSRPTLLPLHCTATRVCLYFQVV